MSNISDTDGSIIYGKTCVSVCVTRMDGQTACLILTKIWEWISIYLGGNIGGLKFTPHQWRSDDFSGPPVNYLFGPLAKRLRRLLLSGGPLAGPFSLTGPPRSRGLRGPRYATAPHLSKWSPPCEVDLENLPDETFGRPLLSNISGAF